MPNSETDPTRIVQSRRRNRQAVLLALYQGADGSPAPQVPLARLTELMGGRIVDVHAHLLVLESMGLVDDVDAAGAALTGRGALVAEQLIVGELVDLAAV